MAVSAIAASAIFAVITLANPPAGTPGTTYGILAVNNNNIGVSTTTPATKLDVNGSTTIRGWLDMAGNTIKNLAIPATSTDAASKAYVDAPGKLWGQGRPGTLILNAAGASVAGSAADAGECTVNGIRVGRSSRSSNWDGASAACPANWWVCTASERGAGSCGTGGRSVVTCAGTLLNGIEYAWVSDRSTVDNGSLGKSIRITGQVSDVTTCNPYPVWCCK